MQVAKLISLVEDKKVDFFHTVMGEAYVVVPVGNHNELYPIKSADCENWLQSLFYNNEKVALTNSARNEVMSNLEARARFGNSEHGNNEPVTLYNRVAKVNNDFWYDLTNPTRQAVEITKEGWNVKQPPTLFKRYTHHITQVMPERGGNVWDIFNYIPLKKNKLLFLCWLTTCFIPDIPHPLTVFYGEQGAAKTTTNLIIRSLVDPSMMETMKLQTDLRSLHVNLQQNWFLPFDNVSKISCDVSDELCKGITGDAISDRQLYTNDRSVIFKYMRCMSINGINNVVLRPDLLDRSILFHIDRISEENRKELSKIKGEFAQSKPKILGGIMDTLVDALKIYPTVELKDLPRMADFTRWGYAIAEALGGTGQQFLDEYEETRKNQNEEVIDADPIASLMLDFMNDRTEWSGKVSDLHTELSNLALKQNINTRSKKFPTQPNQLSRHMKSIISNLKVAGIQYISNGHTRTGTMINLTRIIDPETPKVPEDTNPHEIINDVVIKIDNDAAIKVDADITESPEVKAHPEVPETIIAAPKNTRPAKTPAASKQPEQEAV